MGLSWWSVRHAAGCGPGAWEAKEAETELRGHLWKCLHTYMRTCVQMLSTHTESWAWASEVAHRAKELAAKLGYLGLILGTTNWKEKTSF